jgi:hypothetical protein
VKWRAAGRQDGHCQNTYLLNGIDLIFHSRFWDKIPVSEKRSHRRTQHSSAPVVSYLIAANRHECCYILTRDTSHSLFVSAPPSILSIVTRDNEMLKFCPLSSHPPPSALFAFWHESCSNLYPEPGRNKRNNGRGGRNASNRVQEISIPFWRGMLHIGPWVSKCVGNDCDARIKINSNILVHLQSPFSQKDTCIYSINICLVFAKRNIDTYIFFNCNWVDTLWQQYSTHLHTNST